MFVRENAQVHDSRPDPTNRRDPRDAVSAAAGCHDARAACKRSARDGRCVGRRRTSRRSSRSSSTCCRSPTSRPTAPTSGGTPSTCAACSPRAASRRSSSRPPATRSFTASSPCPAPRGRCCSTPLRRPAGRPRRRGSRPIRSRRCFARRESIGAAAIFRGARALTRFEPDWRLYARSASDDKSPIVALCAALDALTASSLRPTSNLRVILDGEEEASSPSLVPAIARYRDKLRADAMVILDGPIHSSGRPTVAFGARGIVTLDLTVFGPKSGVHSGNYGNWVPNPAERLAALLATMKDDDGRVLVAGFYDGIQPLVAGRAGDARRRAGRLGRHAQDVRHRRAVESVSAPPGRPAVPDAERPRPGQRARRRRGAHDHSRSRDGGDGHPPGQGNAPGRSRREGPGARPHAGLPPRRRRARRHGARRTGRSPRSPCRRRRPTPSGPRRSIRRRGRIAAGITSAFGAPPVQLRTLGGTVPIAPFIDALGFPAVLVPMVNFDNNQHEENENLRLGHLFQAIETIAAILRS